MANLADRIAVLITADGDQAVREFNKVARSASSTGRDVESRLTSGVNGALKKVGVQSEVTSTAIKAAGVAAAGAFAALAVEGISRSIDTFVRLTDEVRNFQRTSGASAQESSRFVAILDDLGISAETGAAAMFRLGRNLETNGKTLAAVGVDAARNADGTTNLTESLLNVADAYTRTTDPAKKADLVFQAFGRSGAALIPVLEQGRRGLSTFFANVKPGQIFSDEDLQKGMDLKLALDDLSDSVEELQRNIGEAAAGPLADFTAGLAALIDKARDAPSGLGKVLRALGEGIPGVRGIIRGTEAILNLGHAQVEANRSTREQTQAIQDQIDAYQQLKSDIDDAADAIFKTSDLEDRAVAAQEKIAQLQSDIADLPAQHARDLADAQDAVTSSSERLRDATRGVTDAQKKLLDLQSGASHRQFAADIASATADLNEAKSKLQRAIDTGQSPNTIQGLQADVLQAQSRLETAQGAEGKAVAQAQDDLASAQRGVRDAAREAADAQDHLNQVRAQDVSKEVEAKQRDLNAAVREEAQLRGQIAEQSGGLQGKIAAELGVIGAYKDQVGGLADEYQRLVELRDRYAQAPLPPPTQAEQITGTYGQVTGAVPTPGPVAQPGAAGLGTLYGNVTGQTTINITGPAKPEEVVKAINENEYLIRQGRPF